MPFQPLIVVILLIFLVLLSLALFIWSLLAMGRSKKPKIEQKRAASRARQNQPQNIGYLSKKELNESLRQKTKAPELKPKPAIKPKPKSKPKSTIPPYQELRPINKRRLSKSAEDAKQRINDIKITENLQTKGANTKPVIKSRVKIKDIKTKEETKKPNLKKDLAKPQLDESKTKTKNDSYRGLNAIKPDKAKEKLDPFDSFVEANKKLG